MKEKANERYFLVTAMCGHVGKRRYVPVNFAVKASSASEAAQQTKTFPRVKKNHKNAILECVEITREQFLIQKDINRRDPYLNAKCHADIEANESFLDRIEFIERRESKKERRPLSPKYKAFKEEWGRIGWKQLGGN